MKVHAKASEADVEEQLRECLKHTPNELEDQDLKYV